MYTKTEKKKVSLNSSLHLILIESLDMMLYNNKEKYTLAKHGWETMEIFCEGITEVRDNQRQILVS